MAKKRAFISFDYDNDVDLKALLVGQARNPDSPFEIVDMSIKETIESNWKENARRRIKGCDVVIVICGRYTNFATGVSAEVKIAQEENVPYFLLSLSHIQYALVMLLSVTFVQSIAQGYGFPAKIHP